MHNQCALHIILSDVAAYSKMIFQLISTQNIIMQSKINNLSQTPIVTTETNRIQLVSLIKASNLSAIPMIKTATFFRRVPGVFLSYTDHSIEL